MLFNKNDGRANERVLYKAKPNMFLGCKKAILGVVLLVVVFVVSPRVIQFVGEMQVYLINQIKLPLTRYAAIAFFVVILVIILFIIWQILSWYSVEYTLTDTKIIAKSGILSTKRNYMPYSTIQDINTSQSFLARLFNVGTVSVFSAYDNNLLSIENVSNPTKVEEIIFSNMMGMRKFQEPPRNYIDRNEGAYYSENVVEDDYYDEYEPITPIGHERNAPPRREYEYYPEDFNIRDERAGRYEYEPYPDEYERVMSRVSNSSDDNIVYEGASNTFSNDTRYNEMRQDYSHGDDDYYQYDEPQSQYDESDERIYQNEPEQVEVSEDSSEKVIQRHFDKFKR